MIKFRAAARAWLKGSDGNRDLRDKLDVSQDASNISWEELWADICFNEDSETSYRCENLLVLECVLKSWTKAVATPEEVDVVNAIYSWVSQSIIPSPKYAKYYEEAYTADDATKLPDLAKFKKRRLEATPGVSILAYLNKILPIREARDSVSVITTLAAFTCEKDPWTTPEAYTESSKLLALVVPCTPMEKDSHRDLLRDIHELKIKPIFSKSKNPDITPAGRKNFYPTPQPRFDPGLFGPETEPWKFESVYIITVLSWVISQYPPSDKALIEAHFNLLYPPLVSLIDDSSIFFKTRGCDLLLQLLAPIEESRSDVLHRFTLAPKFEDSLNGCLTSLPTLTPERESLRLLSSAYPALLSVIRTNCPLSYEEPKIKLGSTGAVPVYKSDNNTKSRRTSLRRVLTNGIIPSYRHISSPSPAENTLISSHPYPRLSTFLLTQITPVLREMGTHSVKYIQELISLLSDALTNPFGTSYLPLLAAAVEATRSLVLNSWPRISEWRGEILNAIGVCWVNICEDEKEGTLVGQDPAKYDKGSKNGDGSERSDHEYLKENINCLKVELQELTLFLRVAVDTSNKDAATDGSSGGDEQAIDIEAEIGLLVDADERLRPLLTPES